MSTLDKVFTTFKRLDKDFARSKKSREEFIRDKFGGDIVVGSVIILDAIRAEGVDDDPDSIAKMSFIRDIFAKIKENSNRLNNLTSFSFEEGNVYSGLMDALFKADTKDSDQHATTQDKLWSGSSKALHYVVTAEGTTYTNLAACKVFRAYDVNMRSLLMANFQQDRQISEGDFMKTLPGRRLKRIEEAAVAKNLK